MRVRVVSVVGLSFWALAVPCLMATAYCTPSMAGLYAQADLAPPTPKPRWVPTLRVEGFKGDFEVHRWVLREWGLRSGQMISIETFYMIVREMHPGFYPQDILDKLEHLRDLDRKAPPE